MPRIKRTVPKAPLAIGWLHCEKTLALERQWVLLAESKVDHTKAGCAAGQPARNPDRVAAPVAGA